jgi:hypothetical protein
MGKEATPLKWISYASDVDDKWAAYRDNAVPDALKGMDLFVTAASPLTGMAGVGPQADLAIQLGDQYRKYTMRGFEHTWGLQKDYFTSHNLNMFASLGEPGYLVRAVDVSAPGTPFAGIIDWSASSPGMTMQGQVHRVPGLGTWETTTTRTRDGFVTHQRLRDDISNEMDVCATTTHEGPSPYGYDPRHDRVESSGRFRVTNQRQQGWQFDLQGHWSTEQLPGGGARYNRQYQRTYQRSWSQ